MHALSLTFRALLEAEEKVIVPTPSYFFQGLIERAGGVFVPVAGREAAGWRWDPEAIEQAVTPKSRVLVLTNPNNPTGYLPAREKIDESWSVAARHDLVVITDEAYERCIHEGGSSPPGAPNVILIRSLGKSLAMPAWRLGFVAGDAVRDRGVPARARVGRHPHRPHRAAGGHGRARRPAGLAGRRRSALPRRPRRRPRRHRRRPRCSRRRSRRLPDRSSSSTWAGSTSRTSSPPATRSSTGQRSERAGYARLPFGGAADLADEFHRRLALATS